MPVALSSLIRLVGEDRILLKQILSSFSCDKDEDIVYFLNNRAVEYEENSKSRTYLICDEEQMNKEDFYLEDLKIYGYVSLALKVLSVPDSMSNRQRKDIDGISAKIHGEVINDFPCYLIGQLSKNSAIADNFISGKYLIECALGIIEEAVSSVGGRIAIIECKNNDKLLKFYADNFFTEISRIPDGDDAMVQMIRKLV